MIELLYKASLWIALFGTLTSTIFLGMVAVASLRFVRARRKQKSPGEIVAAQLPPISLLKPLHGAEPGLREYLESFFALDYPVRSCFAHAPSRTRG